MKNFCDLVINDSGRECSRCFAFKPWSEFHKHKTGTRGHCSCCKKCRNNNVSASYTKNRTDNFGRECSRCHRYLPWEEYYSCKGFINNKSTKCKQCTKISISLKRYGIAQSEYDFLLERSGGVCEICGKEETHHNGHNVQSISIDHCHKTGKVRGLLCAMCNFAIGSTHGSIDIIRNMIQYMNRNLDFKKANSKKYVDKNEKHLLESYGIGYAEYNYILQIQDSKCAICNTRENVVNARSGKVQKLAVDHNHKTGRIRGLLCQSCNIAIGQFKDSPQTMKSAITYLSNAYIG